MATKKAKTVYPKVTVGNHLTVTEYEDGRTELVWDDDKLLQEVRDAISSVEIKPKKKAAARTVVAKKAPAKTTKAKTKTK